MKRKYLIIIFIIIYSLQADDYLLVMSKNNKMCQHMLSIYNKDLRKNGKIVFENHKEYNWVNWKIKYQFHLEQYKKEKIDYPSMEFDINNDGKDELVFYRDDWHRGGVLLESMHYFKQDFGDRFNNSTTEFFHNSVQMIGELWDKFNFQELPIQREEYHITMGDILHIAPFFYESVYYVSLFENWYQKYPEYHLEKSNLAAIVKFDKNNNLEHQCYFIKIIEQRR